MINLIIEQKTIANYSVSMYSKLAAIPDISLIVTYWGTRFPQEKSRHNKDLPFETLILPPIHWQFLGIEDWINLALIIYIIKNKPEVVITSFGGFSSISLFGYLARCLCSLLVDTKFIFRTSYGLLPEASKNVIPSGIKRHWSRYLHRKAVMLTYTQKAADIAKALGSKPDHVFIDYNSMDSDELEAIRIGLRDTAGSWEPSFLRAYNIASYGYVLFVGRIYPEKRLDLLLDAWKLICQKIPETQLVILGSGPARNQAITQSQKLGEKVVFVEGIYETNELAKFFYLADVVVFPGYATLSTHFAMCFRKSIISSQYGNEAEYVQDGKNGFVYEYGNVQDLSEKILSLLNDPMLRRSFGLASKRMVREKINIKNMVNTTAEAVRFTASKGNKDFLH